MVVLICSKFLSVVKVTLPIIEKPKQEKKMRKLTLDEIWDCTKRMWKWVAFQKEVLKDERSVDELKKAWLRENAPDCVTMQSDCFFCQEKYVRTEGSGLCSTQCPGSLVDGPFNCCASAHNYEEEPGAFYREILRLDAIRTAKPPKHVWKHGDVFSNHVIGTQICIHLNGVFRCIDLNGESGTFDVQTRPAAKPKFLFNIKDALSDRGLV